MKTNCFKEEINELDRILVSLWLCKTLCRHTDTSGSRRTMFDRVDAREKINERLKIKRDLLRCSTLSALSTARWECQWRYWCEPLCSCHYRRHRGGQCSFGRYGRTHCEPRDLREIYVSARIECLNKDRSWGCLRLSLYWPFLKAKSSKTVWINETTIVVTRR